MLSYELHYYYKALANQTLRKQEKQKKMEEEQKRIILRNCCANMISINQILKNVGYTEEEIEKEITRIGNAIK